MLLYIIFYYILFLCKVTLTFEVLTGHKGRVESETIFNDVIKNISRVNNVLQDLITNYEHLQKLYNVQDNLESDYTKDTESDEGLERKSKKQKKPEKTTQRSYDTMTQIIISSFEEELASNEKSDVNESQTEESTTTGKIKSNDTENYISSSSKQALRLNDNLIKETDRIETTTKREKQPFGTGKSTKLNKTVKFTKKKRTNTIHEAEKEKKSDFHTTNKNILGMHGTASTQNDVTKKNDIVYVENFSSRSIWYDITKSTPIKMKKEKVLTFDGSVIRNVNKNVPNLRSRKDKTAVIIVTKHKKNKDQSEMDTSKLSSELREEIAGINKDMFKTKMLRQAYGDACLRLVIRKCYKACKGVIKDVCLHVKCKSPLKETFNKQSKTGCIKFFDDAKPGMSNNTRFRGAAESSFTEDKTAGLVDLTRSGYLNGACWPIEQKHLGKKPPILRNDTKQTVTQANPDDELNILRDRFEKACQKISRDKCKSACRFAYTKTCTKLNCIKQMKKRFRKSCKSECDRVYTSPFTDSDSDTSETDSSDSSSISASSSSSSSASSSLSTETDTS